MKNLIRILPLAAIALIMTGCLSSGIDVIVNKDGSGQIIQTFHVQKEYMAFMNLGEEANDPNMINEEELKKLLMGIPR